ncbi:hypothetical protein BGW80DRAFT_614774 [Lactifluus volemus]|nr:hypothetical protein BGW80DRAFT_614774 [Lactifluus volemus]
MCRYHVPRGSSLALPEVRCVSQFPLASKTATYGGEGSNLFYTLRLDDLADLHGRVFGRILSCESAKASPSYPRYYVATPMEIHHDCAWWIPHSSWKAGKWHYRNCPHIGFIHPRAFAISAAHSFNADDEASFFISLGINGLPCKSERPRRTRCGLGVGTTTGEIGGPGRRGYRDHVCKDAVVCQ